EKGAWFLSSCFCLFMKFVIFFFSSRRRHTISYGDWSSDVCSSDLAAVGPLRTTQLRLPSPDSDFWCCALEWLEPESHSPPASTRSEERRVGKECRLWMVSEA